MRRVAAVLMVLLLYGVTAKEASAFDIPEVGDAEVIATLPAEPGLPEGVVVKGVRIYTSTPAGFENFGDAVIYVYNRLNGALIKEIPIAPKYPFAPNALSVLAPGRLGDIYVLNPMQRGVVRLNDRLGKQEDYTPNGFPDLPPCELDPSVPCSPTPASCDQWLAMGMPCTPDLGRPALVNSMAFGPDGALYVSDSFQATIWRVPPGGGDPEIWFQSPMLEGVFGPNGIAINRRDGKLYFNATSFTASGVYTLPLVDDPTEADLELFHAYAPTDGPDELAFSISGKAYVTLAMQNAVSVLSPEGEELARYYGPEEGIPFDAPAGIAFGLGRVIVANHANMPPTPEHYALIGLFVGELGLPLYQPLSSWE